MTRISMKCIKPITKAIIWIIPRNHEPDTIHFKLTYLPKPENNVNVFDAKNVKQADFV